jgi:hypothetical protein
MRLLRILGTRHGLAGSLCSFFALSVSMAGCGGRVLEVTRVRPPDPPTQTLSDCQKAEADPCELPGVPFFAVGYRCVHTTVWLRPVYAVTLTVTAQDKNVPAVAVTKFFGLHEFENAATQTLLAEIKASPPVDDYKPLRDSFEKLRGVDPLSFDTTKITHPNSPESQGVVLSSNSVAPERYVDANTLFYYNVKKPWMGATNAEIDLSDEGILNKASGQVESKTAETLLSMFPVSDLIKSAAGLLFAQAQVKPPAAKPGEYKLDLQIETKVYRHTHSAGVPGEKPPCSPDASLVGADGKTPFNFTVEEVTANPTPRSSESARGAGKPDTTNPQQ